MNKSRNIRLPRPIAVTGASILHSLSSDWKQLADRFLDHEQKSGQTQEKPFKRSSDPLKEIRNSPFQIKVPKAISRDERRQRKTMSKSACLASVGMRMLLEDANWNEYKNIGAYLGVGASGGSLDELQYMLNASHTREGFCLKKFGTAGLQACNPLYAFQLMNNFTLCHGSILNNLTGSNSAIYSRNSGTTQALKQACYALLDDTCTNVLTGGSDSSLYPITWLELERAKLSQESAQPSEGSAFIALSNENHSAITWLQAVNIRKLDSSDSKQLLSHPEKQMLEEFSPDLILLTCSQDQQREHILQELKNLSSSRKIVVSNVFGNALAATPAIAWNVALSFIKRDQYKSVLHFDIGSDNCLSSVCFGTEHLPPLPTDPIIKAEHLLPRPTAPRPKAVITGVGIVSAFGLGQKVFWDGLKSQQSAIRKIQSFDVETFPFQYAGEVPHYPSTAQDLLKIIEQNSYLNKSLQSLSSQHESSPSQRKQIFKRWEQDGWFQDRKLFMAILATIEAWKDAGCGFAEREANLCISLGLETAFLEDFDTIIANKEIDWSKDQEIHNAGIRYRSPVDLSARAIQELLQLQSPSQINVSACAAGGLSLAHAAAMIEHGEASIVISGGADSMLNPLGLGGMTRLGALSPKNQRDACCPFDKKRNGLVMGEGAAIFILESEQRAKERGAKIIAQLSGYGSTQDGYRLTAPLPKGTQAAKAIKQALQHANIDKNSIDYINAHGTGTPLNDPAETSALIESLGEQVRQVPLSSVKAALGHLMAASGAIEAAACLLPLHSKCFPVTNNYKSPDPDCALNILLPKLVEQDGTEKPTIEQNKQAPTKQSKKRLNILSNSFGFGGQNIALIIQGSKEE